MILRQQGAAILQGFRVMAPEQSRSSGGGMLSLYANIPDPEEKNSTAPGTISRAPIVFKQSPETDPQQDNATEKQQQIAPGNFGFHAQR